MTTCRVCGTEITRTPPIESMPDNGVNWTKCACANGPYLRTTGDGLQSAQNCGCDPGAPIECSRHTIDRLERELQDAKRRFAEIDALALQGYSATINIYHNQQYLKIRGLALIKETLS